MQYRKKYILNFIARFFLRWKKWQNVQNLEKKFYLTGIWFQFSEKTNSKFENNFVLGGPLWNEPKHNYVGPAVREWIYGPEGLCHAWFSGRRPISSPKIKNFPEQNVKKFQFYIRMQNFRLLGSIIKKKYHHLADDLNTFTHTLDFHVGPISTNGYSRPNIKVQKKQGTWRAVISKCYYIEINKRCTFCANFVIMYDCFGPAIIVQSTFY